MEVLQQCQCTYYGSFSVGQDTADLRACTSVVKSHSHMHNYTFIHEQEQPDITSYSNQYF